MKERKLGASLPINIYCDIDGVLTYFRKQDSLETVATKGYSLTLEPQESTLDMLRALNNDGRFNVRTLGAVLNKDAEADKNKWLDTYGLSDISRIFVPYGANKREYIEPTGTINILIDDFTENLINWNMYSEPEKVFIGIKYYNDINGTRGRWVGGYNIHYLMSEVEKKNIIAGIAMETYYSLGL